MRFRFLQIISSAFLLAILTIPGTVMQAQQAPMKRSAVADTTIPSAALVQPAELVRMLHDSEKSFLLLQVGSHVLYAEAHIPGSEYVGATGTNAGLQSLRERVSNLRKDQFIVIYCGCCPFQSCPNIRPAFSLLNSMKFTNHKLLNLPHNLKVDWIDHGYPMNN